MNNNNSNWNRIAALAAVGALIISFFSLYQSYESNKIANQSNTFATEANAEAKKANELSNQANNLVLQINLPIVKANSKFDNDAAGFSTETITVNNGGAPIKDFNCNIFTILEIDSNHLNSTNEYIPMFGYFDFGKKTGDVKGLLFSCSIESNYSKYDSLSSQFWEASEKDVEPPVWLDKTILLNIQYKDQFEHSWNIYLEVDGNGSTEIDSEKANDIISSYIRNMTLATNTGFSLDVDSFDGPKLWNFYKTKIASK
jgi:hypothetical protein